MLSSPLRTNPAPPLCYHMHFASRGRDASGRYPGDEVARRTEVLLRR
jgi:hypothetical protein